MYGGGIKCKSCSNRGWNQGQYGDRCNRNTEKSEWIQGRGRIPGVLVLMRNNI